MVCSIGQPYSKLIKYAEENFITRDEAIGNSRWFGSGAEKLGLSGKVNPSSYENAYQGKDDNGNSLRRQLTNKNSRPGRDLTFSAPKSVSVLALVEENKQIIKAHDRAVNRALEYIEQNCIYTRTGKGGSNHQQTNNMVASVFQHHDSRNLDPNLHSHCVIFNQTQGKDGKWRSMDNRELYQQRITIGLVYHHELGQQLIEQDYSIDWNRDGTFDIAGMEREQLDQFSSRRAEIIDVAGVDASSKEKAIACLSTRNTKQYISSAERKSLRNSWNLKYQKTLQKPELKLIERNSLEEAKSETKPSSRDLIDNSIESLGEKNKGSFTSAELLKESLILSQGQHSLKAIQEEINNHPDILPIENNAFTTVELYRQNRAAENHQIKSPEQRSDVLKLADKALSSMNIATHQKKVLLEKDSKYGFSLKDMPDDSQRMSQSVDDYLRNTENHSQSIILTDNENDQQFITERVRERLISDNILSDQNLKSVSLESKELDSQNISQIDHYQPGNAIKFNRASKKFSNQHLYKILSVDKQNNLVKLGDRFGNRKNLPMNRYKNREVFKVERRELRVGEKLRFERGQYINGKQVLSGQSFTITDIKDKQAISIKANNKISVVKTDDLFFARYNYADTLEKYRGNTVERCIYCPSTAKSQQSFQQDIHEVARLTKEDLTVCTFNPQSSHSIEAELSPQKMNLNNRRQPKLQSQINPQLQHQLQPQPGLQPQINPQSERSSISPLVAPENMDRVDFDKDGILYELVSTAKYVMHNQDPCNNASDGKQTFQSSDLIIEKDPEKLSVQYDDKLVEFDQDYNVISNMFEDAELYELNQKTQAIKTEIKENTPVREIDLDLDISR